MEIIYIILNSCLPIVQTLTPESIKKYGFNIRFAEDILAQVYSHKYVTIGLIVVYSLTYYLYKSLVRPRSAKCKLLQNILNRMVTELFDENRELHRITLFVEVGYLSALYRNYRGLLYWIKRKNWKKAGLFLPVPKLGRYLVVYSRCGLAYNKSWTMLRVEEDEANKENGVASYIRYRELGVAVPDLPDIGDITDAEWLEADTIKDIKPNQKRKRLEEYLRRGFINFEAVKKINRRARHFYGTVIQKDEFIWGVLLVDSTAAKNPFTPVNITRFDSFARTLSGIINNEA
jgi:hypothetical protein